MNHSAAKSEAIVVSGAKTVNMPVIYIKRSSKFKIHLGLYLFSFSPNFVYSVAER